MRTTTRDASGGGVVVKTYDFYTGREFYAQDFLGAHIVDGGVVFRTFAPAAEAIEVVLDDNPLPMHKIEDGNFWELFSADAHDGSAYEYRIHHAGQSVDHADPYAFRSELRPDHRSIVCDLSYSWGDSSWMGSRDSRTDGPMNIYEMHLGSWRKRSGDKSTDDPADWYTYEEIAEPLVDYLTESGYNYVEFMPLTEYPFDGSWGYQPTGFFSPTSRYGTPKQLMGLVDALHQAGIGCILDIVPVHFATDPWGLADYDGTPLFEYPNDAVGVSEWGSHNFMYSRGESCSFMQSSANFWLGAYHFDGLRMDAISRIIYWQGDESRGINNDSVSFVRRMNSGVKSLNPGSFLVAEDSTDLQGTTRDVDDGGLGFDYKWDMGWMHDTLSLFQTDPYFRAGNYNKLSFSMMYFRNERYLLPLSHDENVHGKATVAQKMWGNLDLKFPQARTLYLYMMVHPGKKLNFMGSEIAQLREWDENREQDWFLRRYPTHDSFYRYVCELNHLYLENPALWELDYDERGFAWRQVADETHVVYAIERTSVKGEKVLCVLNLANCVHEGYELDLPGAGDVEVLLDTDWQRFGGNTPDGRTEVTFDAEKGSLTLTLPALSGVLLSLVSPEDAKRRKKASPRKVPNEAPRKKKATTSKKAGHRSA